LVTIPKQGGERQTSNGGGGGRKGSHTERRGAPPQQQPHSGQKHRAGDNYLGTLDESALQMAMSDNDNYLLRQSPSSPRGGTAKSGGTGEGGLGARQVDPAEIAKRTEGILAKDRIQNRWHYGRKGREHRVRNEVKAKSMRGNATDAWYSERRRKMQGREEKAAAVLKDEVKLVRDTQDRGVAHLFDDHEADSLAARAGTQKMKKASTIAGALSSSPMAKELPKKRGGHNKAMSSEERRALADSLAATAPASLHRVKPKEGSLQAITSKKQGHTFNPLAPRRLGVQVKFGVQPKTEDSSEHKTHDQLTQKEKDDERGFMKAWVLGSSHEL
jgi:hypothetical protein